MARRSRFDILGSVIVDDTAFLYGATTGNQQLMNDSLRAMSKLDPGELAGAYTDLALTLLGGPSFGNTWNNISTVATWIKSYYDLRDSLEESDTKIRDIDS